MPTEPVNTVCVHALDGEILSRDDTVHVSIVDHPFRTEARQFTASAGLSIAEIVAEIQPDPVLRGYGLAWINGNSIPYENWHLVRPKPGTYLDIRMLPQGGGGGKNPFRILLTIALIVASVAIPALLPASLTSLTVFGSLTVGGLISAGILTVGGFLINMIAPIPKPKLRGSNAIESDTPTEFISGARNQINPFGVVPQVLGKRRVVPPYGAIPYTETVGGEQYVRMLFIYGYGPITRSDQKIGETPLSQYDDVDTDFRRGYPSDILTDMGSWSAASGAYPASPEFGYKYTVSVAGTVDGVSYVVGDTIIFNGLAASTSASAWDKNHDKPFTLYPRDVFQDDYSITLTQADGAVIRTSRDDADELSVDLAFLNGLVKFGNNAKKLDHTVTITIEYRKSGTAGSWLLAGTVTTTGRQTNALVTGKTWKTGERAKYDIRVTRTTADTDDSSILDESSWIAVRTITWRDPVAMDGIAGEAIRIKATDQLKGVVDEYNAVIQSIVKDYDFNTGTWTWRPSSNNASLARHVFQSKANGAPLPDSRLHLESFELFHDYCRVNGFEFNKVIDSETTVSDVINNILAAGRGSRAIIDNKWGITFEEQQSVPVQHITPRNSWGFEGTRLYPETPHAFRIPFFNRNEGWNLDEIVVYDDGYNKDGSGGLTAASKFLELDFEGITDPDHMWKMGRFHFAQIKLRPDRYKVWMDMEHIVARRGSLVLLTHDVISTGLGSARIKEIILDSNSDVTQIVIDDQFEMELGQNYGISIRTVNNTNQTASLVTTPGITDTLTLLNPINGADAPAVGSLLVYGYLGTESLECIVAAVNPGENNTAQLELYDAAPDVHASDTAPIPPYTSNISVAAGVTYPAVIAIRSDEDVLIVNPDGSWVQQIQLTLGFTGRSLTQVAGIQARFRPSGTSSPWNIVDTAASASEIILTGVEPEETYDIQVRYLFDQINRGGWGPVLTHTVVGPKEPPVEPTNVRLVGNMLHWDYPNPPKDIWGFYIRYQRGDSEYWFTGTDLHPGVWPDSPFDISSAPSGTITFLIKAVDVAGNESVLPATLLVTRSGTDIDYILDSEDYAAAGYPGAITNGTIVGSDIQSGGTTLFWTGSSASKFWSANSADLFWSSNFLPMVYEFWYTPPTSLLPTDFMTVDASVTADSWVLSYGIHDPLRAIKFGPGCQLNHGTLAGAVDHSQGMCALTVKRPQNVGTLNLILTGGNYVDINWRTDGKVFIRVGNSGVVFQVISTVVSNPTEWHTFMFSWDTNFAAGAKIMQIYDLDTDISTGGTVSDSSAAFNVGYTVGAWTIGNASETEDIDFARVMVWIGERLDLAVEANRRKIVRADGVPADVGSDGSLVTGTAPIIFHELRTTDATLAGFNTNRGTGGNPTLTGTPVELDSVPGMDQIAFLPMPNILTNLDPAKRYRLKLQTNSDVIQGIIHDLTLYIGAQPISERIDNVAISSAGTTRLPLSKSYREISNVVATVLDDGGSAVRVKVFDKSLLGPLIKTYDTTDTLTNGHVDAHVTGY